MFLYPAAATLLAYLSLSLSVYMCVFICQFLWVHKDERIKLKISRLPTSYSTAILQFDLRRINIFLFLSSLTDSATTDTSSRMNLTMLSTSRLCVLVSVPSRPVSSPPFPSLGCVSFSLSYLGPHPPFFL